MSTGGVNSLTKLNNVMEQIFSEFHVLETENLALHKSVQSMEAAKAKYDQAVWATPLAFSNYFSAHMERR